MRVKAKGSPSRRQVGYYNDTRIYEGQEFNLRKDEDFSEKWMEKIDDKGKVIPQDEKSTEDKHEFGEREASRARLGRPPKPKSTGDTDVI